METKSGLIELFCLTSCALIIIGYIGYNYGHTNHNVMVYDCRMVEISPDIPPAVKEECRRYRYVK